MTEEDDCATDLIGTEVDMIEDKIVSLSLYSASNTSHTTKNETCTQKPSMHKKIRIKCVARTGVNITTSS